MSMGQVVILNSERRRRALVRSWACMRLESAIKTAMAAGADKIIRARAPNGAGLRNVLILGVKVEGLKETCHFIRMRLSNRESGLRCCGKTLMSQIGIGELPAV
jgi:hypothetical protein